MDYVKMLLSLSRQFLLHAQESSSQSARDTNETISHTYYQSAWLVAGGPARSDEWPGYAVWSARETMKRAA